MSRDRANRVIVRVGALELRHVDPRPLCHSKDPSAHEQDWHQAIQDAVHYLRKEKQWSMCWVRPQKMHDLVPHRVRKTGQLLPWDGASWSRAQLPSLLWEAQTPKDCPRNGGKRQIDTGGSIEIQQSSWQVPRDLRTGRSSAVEAKATGSIF